ncbi:hypothetical protein QQX98_003943 [Neonectria punicea]|uniref:Integral membrane protein n=1 Tax=Neonectria punicea TaxID=979145 RepID=A0ABR1HBJ9_9HYPO
MMAKAGEIVQQANLEYQRRQQQQQQQQQQQGQQQQGQYEQGRQGQYGQTQQYGQQGQYGQPPQYQPQPYIQQQQPTPSPWQQQADQELARLRQQQAIAEQQAAQELAHLRQQQTAAEQQAAQELAYLRQQQSIVEQQATQELDHLRQQQAAAVQQAEADRQYAERLAAQYRAEHEQELQRLDLETERLRAEEQEAWRRQTEQPPPVPPRPQSSVPAPTSGPAVPPRPGVVRGAGRAEGSSNNPFREGFEAPQRVSPGSTQPVQVPSPRQSFPPPPANPVQQQPQQSSPRQPQPSTNPFSTEAQPSPRPSRTPDPPKPHPSGITPLAECSSDAVTYDLDWFYHPHVPGFLVCGRCYVDHIYDTSFRDVFARTFCNDKTPRRCRFGSRRMKGRLWPEAVATGNIGPVVEFMEKRANIDDCPKAAMKEGESWYTTAEIPGMTLCKACFEDDLMATPFGSHFQLRSIATQAFCDSTTWYVRRIFDDCAKTNNWAAFVEGVKTRLQLPACPKQAVIKANDRAWFKSSRGPEGLQVCVSCYYDYFHDMPGGDVFRRVSGGDFDTRCVMSHLNLLIPTHHAVEKKDMDIFWTAIRGVDEQPFCSPQGTSGAVWYTLRSDPAGFGICGGCRAGIVGALGGTGRFVRKPGTAPADALLCCFNLAHHRAQAYLSAYAESLLRGDWAPLEGLATTFGAVPPCQRRHLEKGGGRRVWGWGVAAICEECYLSFAKGTSLEPRFVLRGERDAADKRRMCDLYSPRMRGLYTQACASGDLAGFLAAGEHRHQVWCETIAVCEQLLTQQRLAAMRAQTLGISGSFYKSLGGTMDATMGHSYTVGNAYAGYGHANEYVLQGHVYDRQASEMRAQAGGMGSVMRVGMLEARWEEVE